MSAYICNFVESVDQLPAELHRCFGLMRELDTQAVALQRKVDADAQAALNRSQVMCIHAAAHAAALQLV